MKQHKLTMDDVVNWWLDKYHNTNIKKVISDHPEWDMDNFDSHIFYEEYQVTQEQHDEWREWLVKRLMKEYKLPRKAVEKSLWSIYLNSAPMVKNKNNE